MNRYLDRIEIGVNGSDCYTYNDLRAGKNQWPFDQPQYLLLSKLATKGLCPRTLWCDQSKVIEPFNATVVG